ncbi:MAG: FAD-dependent oxidoreductase, partial [Gammaproteobacteria bacterium]|nr:FAD-dependent oxidoreductase [Gammaproteobacteria bacterium]
MTSTYSTDIAIFGGGIAGLWLLNRFQAAGYQAILLDTGGLGSGQTLASQGIIHGGLKYALSGSLSNSANTIAGMPQRWRQCLSGEDEVDLTDCRVLSENYYMWSDG